MANYHLLTPFRPQTDLLSKHIEQPALSAALKRAALTCGTLSWQAKKHSNCCSAAQDDRCSDADYKTGAWHRSPFRTSDR
jgi:hypothetical protein